MKRINFIAALLLSFALVFTSACQPSFPAGNFTDDLGRSVNITKPPSRIVSHVPSITECLFALGLGNKVVGRSDYCDYPPEASTKPSIGDYFNPSVKKIVSMEPDIVFTDGHSDSVKKLTDLGVTFFTVNPKNMDDIFRTLTTLGKITGSEAKAQEVIDSMKKDISEVTEKTKNAKKVRVFYAIETSNPAQPWTAGPGSFIDDFIKMSGGENVAANAPGAWVQMSIETIVAADPEVIIMASKHGTIPVQLNDLKGNAAWKNLTAVKNNHIAVLDADLIDRSGPRITQGLRTLAAAIHPELFK